MERERERERLSPKWRHKGLPRLYWVNCSLLIDNFKVALQIKSLDLHSDEVRPIVNSNTSVNTIKKIKIKKKKSAQKLKERAYLAKDDELYDMIEKIQGDRLDNQRCDCSVTKFFDDKYSLLNETKMINRVSNTLAKSSTARLESVLSRPGLCPMVSLPESDHYWSEGWKYEDESNFVSDLVISSSSLSSPSSSSSSSPSPSTESSGFGVKLTCSNFDNGTDNLREAYMGSENLVFYGRNQHDQPFVLSYTNQTSELRAILRLKDTNYLMAVPWSSVEEPIQPDKIVQLIQPEIKIKVIYPLVNLNGFKQIKEFDNHSISKHFKFGVIYMKKGQTTEEELFSNQEHSEEFDNFLSILGERISLKDFEGFRGGLDTSHGQTGEYSVYEQFQDKEIMFHVSTLLPYNKNDSQQLERKRHIGNDIVAVVFQEDNTPFAPDMIASNFLHAFIVVQKFQDPSSSKTKYRITVTARKDVPNFGPPISNDCIFENDSAFKEWLLNKLINAEYSCYRAEKFKKLKERTRYSLLDKLYSDLNLQNQSILGSLFPSLAETGASDSTSMRLPSETSSSSASGSPLISSANSTSTHNLSNSTSFKFSLINTVRKAFKKDSKEKDLHNSRTSLSKPRSGTVSAVPLSSPSNSPATTPSSENYQSIGSKIRSMTFDSSTEHTTYGQCARRD
ncbi:rap1 GTPase-activating 1-like isoform X7 [Brachionus plicatilis]|uniref:Rap1 GTPase-activating 1-like isoform X7 n=1 Tax=Brachionus plicatilis TaxID=10195 RepID=A0A3M7R4V7_BRAPC|nr:rap1 GTPase-activating 1-like isoform X7 [Brachionus plicatilis]